MMLQSRGEPGAVRRCSPGDFLDELSASFSFDASHSLFDAPSSFARPSHIENAILLAAQFVVIHEEFFEFRYEFLSQIIHVLDVRVTMIVLLDRNHSIVPHSFHSLALLALDNPDRAAFQQTPRKRGLIHQDQYIYRIAILGLRGRHKSKIVRECHSGRQSLFQLEHLLLGVIGVLVAASFASFYDDLNPVPVIAVARSEAGEIRHITFVWLVSPSNLRVLAIRRSYEDTYLGRSRPYGKFPLSSSMDSNSRPCSVCLAPYKP